MLMISEVDARRLLGPKAAGKGKATGGGKSGDRKAQELKLRSDVIAQLIGFPKPVTEHLFHPTRKWRLDFAWPEHQIAIEVHGGVHSGGRHTRGTGFTEDREKMNEAALMGWTVIEATSEQVRNGKLRAWLEQAFSSWEKKF